MPVEQGLPWHPVATGLAGQAIPFIVASDAHALPSAPFWFPVPAILVASPACCAPPPCLLCSPLSLLVWPPRSVCLCCSSPCRLALLGAPIAHPLLSHPPAPPVFTSPYDVDCPMRGWLVTALLPPPWRAPPGARGAVPALVEYVGTQTGFPPELGGPVKPAARSPPLPPPLQLQSPIPQQHQLQDVNNMHTMLARDCSHTSASPAEGT